jgi:hypothetical protein
MNLRFEWPLLEQSRENTISSARGNRGILAVEPFDRSPIHYRSADPRHAGGGVRLLGAAYLSPCGAFGGFS